MVFWSLKPALRAFRGAQKRRVRVQLKPQRSAIEHAIADVLFSGAKAVDIELGVECPLFQRALALTLTFYVLVLSSEVQRICKFWLSTFRLLAVPSDSI